MIALCDCDNFYASCERVFNPSLIGRPIIVLSNNDGCVIARSNESKALGIKMGQPLYQIKKLIEQHNVSVHSSCFQLYGDMSERVMMTLKQNVPEIEIYSIDEAFLNIDGIPVDELESFGRKVAYTVYKNTGIPVSIGIAPTKTLAKVASKLCKKYPKLNRCCFMYKPEDIKKVLSNYPIEDIWGIGRRYAKMLKENGIHTAEDFRNCRAEWVKSKMGITGLRTWTELHGEKCIDFETSVADRQSIMVSRSFSKEQYELSALQESIATFTSLACEKLRKQSSVAGQLQVFILTNRHREDRPQHNEGAMLQFTTPTDSTLEIAKAASDLLKKIYRKGFGYKKAGVILQNINKNTGVQNSLFDTVDRTKHKSLMNTIDAVNSQMGRSTIMLGSQGAMDIRSNKEHMSPCYTTKWSDILIIKV